MAAASKNLKKKELENKISPVGGKIHLNVQLLAMIPIFDVIAGAKFPCRRFAVNGYGKVFGSACFGQKPRGCDRKTKIGSILVILTMRPQISAFALAY
ncbi:hypothetical protein L0128_00190 [candidate division KSB1 bacterium]|nr:hypothetical protein [candidate division KSB1 bacterium]